MTKVRVKTDEPFEKALRRFKKKCNKGRPHATP